MKKFIINQTKAEKDLANYLEQNFKWLVDLYEKNGQKLYLVGGCVRDTVLGLQPKDWDFCTNATIEQSHQILSQHPNVIGFDQRGQHFAITVAITKQNPEGIEIAQFRQDGFGRKPDVKTDGVTINDDVERRDFTINALFFDSHQSKIIDLVGGVADLNNSIIKTVGLPNLRFSEDPLRKLRAIRFATRFGFQICPQTLQSISDDPSLHISRERVWSELEPAYCRAQSKQHFTELLHKTGLIKSVLLDTESGFKDFDWDNLNPTWQVWLALSIKPNQNISKLGLCTHLINGIKLLHSDPDELAKSLPGFWRKREGCTLTDTDFLIYNTTDIQKQEKIKILLNIVKNTDLVSKFSNLEGQNLGKAINDWYYQLYLDATKCIS